jgi:hypothetical protein
MNGILILLAIVFVLLLLIPWFIARSRGVATRGWLLLVLLLFGWTLIGWAVCLLWAVLGETENAVQNRSSPHSVDLEPSDMKVCPRCAERIQRAAVICRFCGHQFTAGEQDASKEPTLRADPASRQDDAHGLIPAALWDDRYRPNTGISRSITPSQKRTFGATWLGHFRALSRSRIRHYGREASCSGCGELRCRKSAT